MKHFSNTSVVLITTIPALESQSGMIDYIFCSRDLTGISLIEGFNAYVREWHPSFLLDEFMSKRTW